jgi:acetyl-CoA C-acetyltransferase
VDRTPVIVGVGEVTQRTRNLAEAHEPLVLMEQALRASAADAGGVPLEALDAIDVVAEYSWPYADAPGQLAQRLGARPVRAAYGVAGGETPVRFLHEAALRIRRGESEMAAVVGAEANYAAAAAARAKTTPPWSPRDANAKLLRGTDYLTPLAVRLGVAKPATVYPFFENAAQAAWGQTPRQAQEESGRLWALCAGVATRNPYAWKAQPFSADEITTPTADNRLVAWPYTMRMVANPMVNQGAAVLVMSLRKARELGVPSHRLVYPWCGAAADEPIDYLHRDRFHRSVAQDAVLEDVLGRVGDTGHFNLLELYSCFPVVPKMARRTLGLPTDAVITAAGGLSFFGAPLNNYMAHATAAVVRGLRERAATALLYGQGGYMTRHHALVLASRAAPHDMLAQDYSVQAEADRRRREVPALDLAYRGPATVETFTVLFDRDGAPTHGVVILRSPGGTRSMARVDPSQAETLDALMDPDESPIGLTGTVSGTADAVPAWSLSTQVVAA